jgi:hypothetical protein
MFVRKKKNRSGTTSIVVIDKSSGLFREVKTIGISSDDQEIASFFEQGKKWIAMRSGQRDIFVAQAQEIEEKQATDYLINNIENIPDFDNASP